MGTIKLPYQKGTITLPRQQGYGYSRNTESEEVLLGAEGGTRKRPFAGVYWCPPPASFLVLLSVGMYGCLLLSSGLAVGIAVKIE